MTAHAAGRVSVLCAFWRGLRLSCPRCGARTLFRGYLQLSPDCRGCGADFSNAETADVAPYVTVFLIGLIAMPSLLLLGLHAPGATQTPWLLPSLLVGVCALTLAVLPRVKGVLAALLWRAGRGM